MSRPHQASRADAGGTATVPIIGAVLTLSIILILALATYVWVRSGDDDAAIGDRDDGVVRVVAGDKDKDGLRDMILLTLVRGDGAPYLDAPRKGIDQVSIMVSSSGGTMTDEAKGVCITPPLPHGFGPCGPIDIFTGDDTSWDMGQVLYVQCTTAAPHAVAVALRGKVVFEGYVDCEEPT